jgi:hypothetical protein
VSARDPATTVKARFNDTLRDMPKVTFNCNVVNSVNDIPVTVACSLSLDRNAIF